MNSAIPKGEKRKGKEIQMKQQPAFNSMRADHMKPQASHQESPHMMKH
jgi:hypothetical protein